MTLKSKIGLSRRYGKAVYLVSAILTLGMSVVAFFHPVSIPACVLLKLLSIPAIFYLFTSFSPKQEMYFYLNLGISRNEYHFIPFVVEFIAFALLMILSGSIGYAIS